MSIICIISNDQFLPITKEYKATLTLYANSKHIISRKESLEL